MSLQIENEETIRMAEELAARRGVSVEAVVEEALRKAVEAEPWRPAPGSKAEKILKIAREFRQGLPDGVYSSDHSEFYDENGLPQ